MVNGAGAFARVIGARRAFAASIDTAKPVACRIDEAGRR